MTFSAVGLDIFEIEEKIGAGVAKTIKRTGFDGSFPGFFIELSAIYALSEVANRLEWAVLVALWNNDIFDQGLTHVFDARKAEADGFFAANDGEITVGLVDVWAKDFEADVFAFVDFDGETVGPAHVSGHEGGHEGVWIVSFEIGSPIGDEGVASGVGLVKAVISEF